MDKKIKYFYIKAMETNEEIIAKTRKWIQEVVIACNFCPFAAKQVKQNTIYYQVENAADHTTCLNAFSRECERLDNEKAIATTLLILPNSSKLFSDYLILLSLAENFLVQNGYEGIYQVASFHPQYCFADAKATDAANYTNRSVYPMLHLLREDYIEEALLHYTKPEKIPANNIDFARKKGITYMKMLRDSCL